VVEDDAIVAMDVAASLEDMGCRVLGPAGDVGSAHRLLDRELPDLAVLDVNLNGHTVAPIARRLQAENVPFLLSTACARADLSEPVLSDAPLVRKPATAKALAAAVRELTQ
jgi:two-component system, response regulator PdtaR